MFRGRLPEQPTKTAPRVSSSDRPPGQANPGDDHDRKHDLWRAGRRKGSRLGSCLPGHGVALGKGGWETQTHPHLPVSLPLVRGSGSAHSRRGSGLPDSEGDGRIPDHPRSGFTVRNGRGRACSNFSAFASTGILADAQPETEVKLQGAIRVSSNPVQGTVKPGSTGNSTEGAATEHSIGRCVGVGGEAIRRRSVEHLAGPASIRVHGAGAGSDQLRAGGKTERNHLNNPISPQGPGDGWTQGPDCRTHQ